MTLEQNKGMPLTLPEGTVVEGCRILSVLHSNGESTVYEAQNAAGELVWLREFLPKQMVCRNAETLDLQPTEENQTIYKYSLAAFEELFKLMKNASLEYILPVEELFYAHNTIYVLKKALKVKSLKAVMEEKGHPFTWMEAKKSMLPLMNSVAQLHEKGVVHLGIAPENLYVTEDQHLIMAGFSTLEARTSDGELDHELYEGFSSPEQYSGGDWKGGPCSDVYALAAVLYWMLTGEIPQSAELRMENDELPTANEKQASVPENVSDAISGAMMLDPELRAACVDDFTSALLESVSGNTTVYEVPEVPNEYTVHLEPERHNKKRMAAALVGGILFVLATLGLAFGAYIMVNKTVFASNQQEESSENSESEQLYTVPDFVGHKYQDIMANENYKQNFVLNAVQEYNDSYPEGVIVAQSIAKNTEVSRFTTIVLTVSMGKETITMPNLIGWGLSGAKYELDQLGLPYKVYVVENKNYTANTVFRTDPSEGVQIALSDGTEVKIYVTPEETVQEEKTDDSKTDKKSSSKKNTD